MTPCSPAKTCRRQMMLAAVAATVLLLTAPHNDAQAQKPTPEAKQPYEAMMETEDKKLPPVSAAELDKAKAEIEKMRTMTAEERVNAMVSKREAAKAGDFEAHRAEMRAQRAYIKTLPESERAALKEQMKEDRKLAGKKMKEKWEAMTPQEREAVKAKHKAEFDKLPEDVKAKIKERRKSMKHDGPKGEHSKGKAAPPAAPAE